MSKFHPDKMSAPWPYLGETVRYINYKMNISEQTKDKTSQSFQLELLKKTS